MIDQLPVALPALITPFTAGGDVDGNAHSHNVSRMVAAGFAGVLIGGSTGEGTYLEPGERRHLIEVTLDAQPGLYLMAGIAAETDRAAGRQLAEAAEAGAYSVLVLTPTTMARHDPGAIFAFYEFVAGASPIPVLLYSVPKWTAYELPEDAVVTLARHPNVIGMKDSSGNVGRISRLIDQCGESFAIYNGSSAVMGPALWAGVFGGIAASGNYAPQLLLDVVAKQLLDDHRRLARLAHQVEAGGIPAVKAAAAAAGLRPGLPRAPLAPADPATVERLRQLLNT